MARQRRRVTIINPLQDPMGSPPPDAISDTNMEAAIDAGQATAFSQVITFIRRYRQTWWLSTDVGWLKVRDPIAPALDEHAARMRQPASKSAAASAVIRAVIELARETSIGG